MLCDQCHERDAVLNLTQIVENAVTQLHLCEKCAAERGIETHVTMPKQPLADFIQAVQQKQLLAGSESWRCTFCNSTLRDFRNTSRLGCAYCYDAFEAKLRDLLRGVHGTSKHQGKRYRPPAEGLVEEGASVATELRTRLRRAVEQEHFEEAAKLRDQLKVME